MVYELLAYNTDSRYRDDVRYRKYTTSRKLAEAFGKIPKIQFTDSGHGIVFTFKIHVGTRKKLRSEVADYVKEHLKL